MVLRNNDAFSFIALPSTAASPRPQRGHRSSADCIRFYPGANENFPLLLGDDLVFGEAVNVGFGHFVHDKEEDGVGPAEADDVDGVAASGSGVCRAVDGIVF